MYILILPFTLIESLDKTICEISFLLDVAIANDLDVEDFSLRLMPKAHRIKEIWQHSLKL